MNRSDGMRSLVVVLGLLPFVLFAGSAAQDYRVDVAGGSPLLEEEVVGAFGLWQEATESELEAQLADDANTVFRYGDTSRFGPDTLSLTISRTTGEGAPRQLEILVNPAATEERAWVLLHEAGRVLGLPPAQEGIMSPARQVDAPAELTPADIETLQARQTSVPEDVNRDGVVDFYDLVQFGREFGRTGVGLASDINADGVVDRQDLALLQDAYTFGAPSETPRVTEPETAETDPEADEATEELPGVPDLSGADEEASPEEPESAQEESEEGFGEDEEPLDEEEPTEEEVGEEVEEPSEEELLEEPSEEEPSEEDPEDEDSGNSP